VPSAVAKAPNQVRDAITMADEKVKKLGGADVETLYYLVFYTSLIIVPPNLTPSYYHMISLIFAEQK